MERPWLDHYDDGVPATLAPYPQQTLVDIVKATAAERPRHTAAIFKGARLSYGELNGLSDGFAAWLAARGVVKGDRVALLMPNCPQVIIAQLGVWKAGAVAVPLNPLSSEEELAHALAGTGARAAVVLTRFYHKIKHLQPGTALEVVIATNIKEFLPRVLRLAYTLLKERKEGDRVTLASGDVRFQTVIRDRPAVPPRTGPTPSDAALLMLTGGTTGVPKAALLRHHGVLMAAMQINRWFRPLLAETKRRFEQLTGARIIEVYSLTEACMAAVGTPVMGTYKEGAVGIPLPDVEVRIVDVDDPSQEVGPGEIGEIVIEAPQLMEGYWHNPEATTEMLREGRLYTGDLGLLDGDGYLTIVDRKKDLIKASGFQVWPREVEEVIATHAAVAEVGVAGVPDAHSGEAVMAWVVTRKGMGLTEEEVRDHCRRHLAAYKVPKRVEVPEALPKSAIGKLLRRELAREFRAAHGSA